MKQFAQLIFLLGTATKTNIKVAALEAYFKNTSVFEQDKVWLLALFTNRQPRKNVGYKLLRAWCAEITDLEDWLFNECYLSVGDLAETIALLLPKQHAITVLPTLTNTIENIADLNGKTDDEKKQYVVNYWEQLNQTERFAFNKLLTGNFRIGVSESLVIKALANVTNQSEATVALNISGNWSPYTTSFDELINGNASSQEVTLKPYPYFLSYPLETELTNLGSIDDWQTEWKWDGIRGQIVKRNNTCAIWSRGEDLLTEKFPELKQAVALLPDNIVLDGEIICLQKASNNMGFQVLPFSLLQTRITRKNVSKKQLQDAPVGFIAYDVLQYNGADIRNEPLHQRRNILTNIITHQMNPIYSSPIIKATDWDSLAHIRSEARNIGSEGFMIKNKKSPYLSGRKKGYWWKWKLNPFTIDAVLIYAQKGHGRRSNLYTDYTFAVKDGESLVPFTKAYSGLTDAEFAQVDNFVKKNALEKFGPVRTVKPELVFEIAFEGIAASNRHKSGIALRFPRMQRWRKDKPVDEINTLTDLQNLLKEQQTYNS